MPTQKEIADAWGVSSAYVSQLISKRGMPREFGSIEEATEWREQNAMRRKSPMSKPGPKPKGVKEKTANLQKTKRQPSEPMPMGDGTLESALRSTIRVAEQAESLVLSAMRQKNLPEIPPLLSIHNKAVEARFSAERAYREEMEKSGLLISKSEGTELWRQGFSIIINKMKRIPQNKAQLCNPQSPLIAFGVLEDAVNEILDAAQKIYAKFNVQPQA